MSSKNLLRNCFLLLIFYFYYSLNLFASEIPTIAPAMGQQAMVVSAQHLATQVGVDVLKKGGNAIDAAVAIGYALAVVHPCCGNIGGGGFMLIHLADGKNTFINFREKAPLKINPRLFEDAHGNVRKNALSGGYNAGSLNKPYLAIGVPGTVLGLNTALKKYGSMPLAELMQPAINFADKGFILTAGDIKILHTNVKDFAEQPNVAAIFLKNNHPYKTGDRLIQKNLAYTLKEIAARGSDAFYKGDIADKIVKASQENGGILTKKDFSTYTVEEEKPITCHYRNDTVITSPPPGSGVTVCEILNIVDGYPLNQLGYHTANSIHDNVEAMRYAFADRNTYLGDPDFVKQIPIAQLISPEYAAQIRQKISPDKAGDSRKIGFVAKQLEGGNTTSFVVVDKAGNAVSVIYTINDLFGAKVIPGDTGFFLNNELGDFTIKADVPNTNGLVQGTANLIEPGKRPLSSMSPTFIMRDKQVFMLVGTPGGPTIITQIVEAIENVIDYRMNVQQAVDAPRYHMQWLPDIVYIEPNIFSNATFSALKKMGYTFEEVAPLDKNRNQWGAVTAIAINPKTKIINGAMDYRRPNGLALGY